MRRVLLVLVSLMVVFTGGSPLRAADALMGPMPDISEPGRASATGTWLAVTGSEYLDVTVSSTEIVRMWVQSIPRTVRLRLEPAGGGATSVITVGGLPARATFYVYVDAESRPLVLATDKAGTLSLTLDITSERVLSVQPDHSTYFLGDNGWTNDLGENLNGVVGTWDSVTRTATVLGNLGEAINVTADNLVLDGAGHTLTGTDVGSGITINTRAGVTLRNFRIRHFSTGINSSHCSNIVVERMDIRDCGNGMFIDDINVLAFRDSVLDRCDIGIYDYGFYNYQITISNNTFSNTNFGGYAEAGRNLRYENNVFNRCGRGLGFLFSLGNSIVNNVFAQSGEGVRYDQVHTSPINGNVITGANTGIYFYDYCWQNVVTRNELSANGLGFGESQRPGGRENAYNSFYNNNVVGNTVQITTEPDTYYADYYYSSAAGGNYWSDWTGPDADGNGYVDLPYVFTSNTDLLPFAAPLTLPNHRPVLEAVSDRATTERVPLEFTVAAFDVDGDPVTLSASNLPSGAQFYPATGVFSWTPGYDQAGTYAGVEFKAADDAAPAAVSVERITITVADDTVPPTVVSTDPANLATNVLRTVVVRVTYSEPLVAGAAFNNITLKKGRSVIPIQRAIVGNTLVLTPGALLAARSGYAVSIPANALKDPGGNNVSAYGFSFTTGRN